jgi:hypothetical protein
MTTTIIIIIAIGLITFAIGFVFGAYFAFRGGFQEGRDYECAKWVYRLATPEGRQRVFGDSCSENSQQEKAP